MAFQTQCRHFNGYKPCGKNTICDESCTQRSVPSLSVLIVHLGALGAVVRSTSLLRGIKRKYPNSVLTWVTDSPAQQLLQGHPAIDRVFTTNESDLLVLGALEFDVALVIDKSLKAMGVLKRTQVDQIFGFIVDPTNGAILPATNAANELWELGLSNEKKFFQNKKSETQLIFEALELGDFNREEYWLHLTEFESLQVQKRRLHWLSRRNKTILVGVNTGCSGVIPYKKLSVDFQRVLISEIQARFPEIEVVLLGGPEDALRNKQISAGLDIETSETENGLRDGLISVAACDIVITGDSLGMHMAIAQKKQVIAWFGPTCAHEIDIYDRGVKIYSQATCGPCWKRACEKSIMCYDQVSIEEIFDALKSCCSNCIPGRSTSLYSTP